MLDIQALDLLDTGEKVAGVLGVVSSFVAVVIAARMLRSELKMSRALRAEFQSDAAQSVKTVQETQSTPAERLEADMIEVSQALHVAFQDMRDIIVRAEAFEDGVRKLIIRADAAEATAKLNEEDARKISVILGARTEEKFKEEIEKLTAVHDEQMEKLRKSGTRVATWTFIAGAVLGFAGNLLSSALTG
ncbi:hypothetical protein [Plantactinospora sonchi]|uniref:DUF1640 domain-containing protein n=1 Tax=Plantactinospora sonchi TaxID=1544735 RepID=A0ABU7RX35_9ACTN